MVASPEQSGWSAEALGDAHRSAEAAGSAAVLLVDGDDAVVAWGEVARPYRCHSVRKSLLSLLYGEHVESGAVDLTATLAELDVDDLQPLSDAERSATVAHLLQSRSGVYHPAAKEPPDMKRNRPARASHEPGDHWWYNNWDFNVAGVILERLTERSIEELFQDRLAEPLGLEDLGPEWFAYQLEPRQSLHPAYAFRLSARDLARIGRMVVQDGRIGDRDVVPLSWIRESTQLVSPIAPGRGYGWMWWVYEPGSLASLPTLNRHRILAASGTGGQLLAVLPDEDVVFVHRADTEAGRSVRGDAVWQLFEDLLGARPAGGTPSDAATLPLAPTALAGVAPPAPRREAVELASIDVSGVLGGYRLPTGQVAELFLHEGALFVSVPGVFEAQLFAASPSVLFARAARVEVALERDEEGRATGGVVHAEGREMPIERVGD